MLGTYSKETLSLLGQAKSSSETALLDFNQSRFFGNIAFISSYDSNVLSVPSSGSIQGTSTDMGSLKGALKASIGYASKPLDSVQIVPSYQGAINLNTNKSTQSGEFFTHDVSVYVNHEPYAQTSYGAKIEAIGIFQYQANPDTNTGAFGPYSLQASVGPYIKHEIARRQFLGAEFFYEPIKNYLDPAFSPTARRSGKDFVLRPYFYWDRLSTWWNPSYSLSGTISDLDGSEYRSKSLAFRLGDHVRWSHSTDLNLFAEAGVTNYPDRPSQPRFDRSLILDAATSTLIFSRTAIVTDFQYQLNLSTVPDTYQYHRLIISAGVAYGLF
jgi:hypothetical protein